MNIRILFSLFFYGIFYLIITSSNFASTFPFLLFSFIIAFFTFPIGLKNILIAAICVFLSSFLTSYYLISIKDGTLAHYKLLSQIQLITNSSTIFVSLLFGLLLSFVTFLGALSRITKSLIFMILYYCGYVLFFAPILLIASILARYLGKKKIDVGLGPEPMINNVYHKKALQIYGYTAETFVDSVYFITSEFDYRGDLLKIKTNKFFKDYFYLLGIWLFIRSIFRYKSLYIYFNGSSLKSYPVLSVLEPHLLRISRTKVVVMPYGGDIHDMMHCPNLLFKNAMAMDYPSYYKMNERVKKQIVRWTNHADVVISGCDWVDYTYHWDILTLAHFSIDIVRFDKLKTDNPVYRNSFSMDKPLRVLHAPNHKTIKGTSFVVKAIEELQNEGRPVELILLQGRANTEIIEEIAKSDLIIDQLVIGWYAMFALESLCMAKPVVCNLRQDLVDLYVGSGLLSSHEEVPFINGNIFNIKQILINILDGKINLSVYGKKSYAYVSKHHSIEKIGQIFDDVNKKLNLSPSV